MPAPNVQDRTNRRLRCPEQPDTPDLTLNLTLALTLTLTITPTHVGYIALPTG